METLAEVNNIISGLVWGPPMLVLLLATGVFLIVGLRFFPWRSIKQAIGLVKSNEKDAEGIPPRAALFTALSATIGTGNIGGVATAIVAGGPGAVFYMWLIAIFGMATKYAEAFCAVKFRHYNEKGLPVGGPMYYLSAGFRDKGAFMASFGKVLATFYAVLGVVVALIAGNAVQVKSIADVLQDGFNIPHMYSGILVGAFVGLVILGGIKRIAEVADKLIPSMTIIYLLGGTIVLMIFARNIPAAFASIFEGAFTPRAALGGSIYLAIRYGFARGVFSNEAGIGSAAIAHGAAATKDPFKQGQIAMLGVGVDTIIVCTFTALVILSSGQAGSGINGPSLTSLSFASAFPAAEYIVVVSLTLFAFTTVLGWSYYGECCLGYLGGEHMTMWYRILFVLSVILGANFELTFIWALVDTLNGFMILPNLIGLLILSPIIFKETLRRMKERQEKQGKLQVQQT